MRIQALFDSTEAQNLADLPQSIDFATENPNIKALKGVAGLLEVAGSHGVVGILVGVPFQGRLP